MTLRVSLSFTGDDHWLSYLIPTDDSHPLNASHSYHNHLLMCNNKKCRRYQDRTSFPLFLQIFHLIKFLHCNSRSCQNLTQPLHVCSQPEKEKNNCGQCGFLQNTWQGRGGAGSYVAAEGHSCSRAPGRRPPSPPRWSPAPWPSG